MRLIYEQRSANPAEAKKVTELEQEVLRTKQYYQKRIRELEDKYKFKVSLGTEESLGTEKVVDVKVETKTKVVQAKEVKKVSVDDDKDQQIK